jgi:hypothetical protein
MAGARSTAAVASLAAGAVHAVAVGLHAEDPGSARLFVLLATFQVAWGVLLLTTTRPTVMGLGAAVQVGAVVGWVVTRTSGIGFIPGLSEPEAPQPLDTFAAVCAAASVVVLAVASRRPVDRITGRSTRLAAPVVAVLGVAAAWNVSVHDHGHGHDLEVVETVESGLVIAADGVVIGWPALVPVGEVPDVNAHVVTPDQARALESGWPRRFDPTAPLDLSGIGGVSPVQEQRARAILAGTAASLARFARVEDAQAAGYQSIGDSVTGYEHYIRWDLVDDGRLFDAMNPESLVYRVDGPRRTLVSAMYIASPGTAINDATLADYAGGLMQWHRHTNLCWRDVGGVPRVSGVTLADGSCIIGSPGDPVRTSPMVHVWISSHQCGPFAAVEGVAAGTAGVPESQRVDLCNASH